MQYMTSGFRAAHNLPPANHDQEPYECTMSSAECHTPRPHRLASRLAGTRYVPRPEYDVPDNPILSAFRAACEDEPELGAPWRASAWVSNHWEEYGDFGERGTTDQIEHARRVLSKLTAVYA